MLFLLPPHDWQAVRRPPRYVGISVDAVGNWNFVGKTAFVRRVVMLVYWLVMSVGENRQSIIGSRFEQARFATTRRTFPLQQRAVGFGYWVELFLLKCASASHTMRTTTRRLFCSRLGGCIGRGGAQVALGFSLSTLLLLVGFRSTLACDMCSAGLAKTSAVRALRDRSAFLVDVGERAICVQSISKRRKGS